MIVSRSFVAAGPGRSELLKALSRLGCEGGGGWHTHEIKTLGGGQLEIQAPKGIRCGVDVKIWSEMVES